MPEHTVLLKTNAEIAVGNVDYVFEVCADDGGKIGELHVSRGGIDWWPRDAKLSRTITWERFAAMWEREIAAT